MSDNNGSSTNILIGLKSILEYLKVSKPTFYKLVKTGLPAIVVDRTWYAHKNNLDVYFQHITRMPMKEIPEDAD